MPNNTNVFFGGYDYAKNTKTKQKRRSEEGLSESKEKIWSRGGGGQGITTYFSNTLAVKFQLEKNAIHYYVF